MRWGAGAWIGILLAIGVVQAVRAQWFDAGVFFAVSVVLVVDVARTASRRSAPDPATGTVRGPWVLIAAVAAGLTACILPRHSVPMQVLVCAVGLAVILLAWRRGNGEPGGSWPPGLRRLALAWSLLVVAGCIWELAQFLIGLRHPSRPAFALSDLLDPLLSTAPGKIVFVALWIAGGAYLLRRGRR